MSGRRLRGLACAEHGDVGVAFACAAERFVVSGVGVAEDAHGGVVGEDALDSGGGFGSAVGDDDLSGVLGEADSDTAAVVEGDPGGAGGDVDGEIEESPV